MENLDFTEYATEELEYIIKLYRKLPCGSDPCYSCTYAHICSCFTVAFMKATEELYDRKFGE